MDASSTNPDLSHYFRRLEIIHGTVTFAVNPPRVTILRRDKLLETKPESKFEFYPVYHDRNRKSQININDKFNIDTE